MASNLFDKILDVFGMGDDMDYEDENKPQSLVKLILMKMQMRK